MCLICGKTFLRRADLTRHAAAKHATLLHTTFSCPQCGDVISSPSEFSNHTERKHGKQYSPQFKTGVVLTDVPAQSYPPLKIPCAICRCNVRPARVLQHVNAQHAGEPRPEEQDLACTVCPDGRGLDIEAWFAHLADRHELPSARRCPFCSRFFFARGLPHHISNSHFGGSVGPAGPVLCPICTRQDGTPVPLQGYTSWLNHCQGAGHAAKWTTKVPADALQAQAGTKRKAEGSDLGYSAHPCKAQWRWVQWENKVSSQNPDGPVVTSAGPPHDTDLSPIDPALLDPGLSDAALWQGDGVSSTGSLLSPSGLDGSTACASPVTDRAQPYCRGTQSYVTATFSL